MNLEVALGCSKFWLMRTGVIFTKMRVSKEMGMDYFTVKRFSKIKNTYDVPKIYTK